jgi:MSHA biogenesis protein MshK
MKHQVECKTQKACGISSVILRPSPLAFTVAWAVIGLVIPCAIAQVMTDPTRPAQGVYSPESTDNAAVAPVLQSVMITPTARTAIIGGNAVKLGAKYGDARVIKITESEVVLRSASGTETLKMYPGVDVKPVTAPVTTAQKPVRRSGKTGNPPARNSNEK